MNLYIYGLKCPIDNCIKYIGQTNDTKRRLNQHIRDSTKTKSFHSKKEIWIKNLIDNNLINKLEIIILEECDEFNINEREIFWIQQYKSNNTLLNVLDGGIIAYQSLKEKMRESKLGNKNPMFGKKRKKLTNEQRLNLSNSIKNSEKFQRSRKSKEYRNKISDIVSINQEVLILDIETNEILFEFKNATEASLFFECTRGNIKNAIRDNRLIGKKIKKLNGKKCRVIRKSQTLQIQ